MSLLDIIRAQGAAFRLTEEILYAEVLREMEAGVRRDGLWAKALSLSNMDITRAHATYIKLRVQSLRDEVDAIRAAQAAEERTRSAALQAARKNWAAQDAQNERYRRARVNDEAKKRVLRLAAENGFTIHSRSSKWIVEDSSNAERFDDLDDVETYIRNVALGRATMKRSTASPAGSLSARAQIFLNFVRWRDLFGARKSLEEDPSLVHATNADGKGPLHLAVAERDADMVAMLLDQGADPDRQDSFGTTARDIALRTTCMPVLRLLEVGR